MTDSLSNLKQEKQAGIPEGLAEKILKDPLLLRRLNDRIYDIFLDEIRQVRDRAHGGNS
jgi:hypothetical protein